MQALVEHRYLFTDANMACTEKVHNAWVFYQLRVYFYGQAGTPFLTNNIE